MSYDGFELYKVECDLTHVLCCKMYLQLHVICVTSMTSKFSSGLRSTMDFGFFAFSVCGATLRLDDKPTSGLHFSLLLKSAGGFLSVAPDLKGVLMFVLT